MSARVDLPKAQQLLPTLDLSRDAFLFDVDGTLLDIAARPDDVQMPPDLRPNLERLHESCGGALALVSGRTLSAVDKLFAPLKLPTAGSHGAEMRPRVDGPIEDCAVPVPKDVREAFADFGKLDPRILVEDKTYTLAFHYRAAEDREDEFLAAARERIRPFEPAFTLLHGKAIIEIKSASFNKGTALQRLMAADPFRGRRPIFCGDDTTDEDAFSALPRFGGIGVSIGRKMAGAGFSLPDPQSLRDWIARLAADEGLRS